MLTLRPYLHTTTFLYRFAINHVALQRKKMSAEKNVKQSQKSLTANQAGFVQQQNDNLDHRRNNDVTQSPHPGTNAGNKQIVFSNH